MTQAGRMELALTSFTYIIARYVKRREVNTLPEGISIETGTTSIGIESSDRELV